MMQIISVTLSIGYDKRLLDVCKYNASNTDINFLFLLFIIIIVFLSTREIKLTEEGPTEFL
jgi:hypothetical protein